MFIVTLKTGERFDFGGKCNQVDYSSGKMVVFKNENEKEFITLAVIPVDNILTIINDSEENREHKRRYNLRLEFIAAFGRWLDSEPPVILFWKWRKWKQGRPVWEDFCKKILGVEFYNPYDFD